MTTAGSMSDAECFRFLGDPLLSLEEVFDFESRIATDPVRFVRRYGAPGDREVAGLVASVFAYGAVEQIGRTLSRVFNVLGDSPRDFVLNRLNTENPPFEGFYHRFNNREDLLTLLWAIAQQLKRWGSLENLFLNGYTPGDISHGMDSFSGAFIEMAGGTPFPGGRNFSYFFPSPRKGSPCKRMCLYLRWMNRKDMVDPGGWAGVDRSDLVVPVDTHIERIARYLGFTRRKNPSWKMAVEITQGLKKLNREDPLRMDFLLCHLGMSGRCPRKENPDRCRECILQSVCHRKSLECRG